MGNLVEFKDGTYQRRSFWKRPEGITGLLFLGAIAAGTAFLIATFWGTLLALIQNTLFLFATIAVLGGLVYVIADPKTRTLLGYMYKSAMRWLTGVFVTIDPIGILKTYVEELTGNLIKMREQIGKLRGQIRQLESLQQSNEKEIGRQLQLAAAARDHDKPQQMTLATRKAARLKESNRKYDELLGKMRILNRILNRMHQNAEILLEDTRDQVHLKEQEARAIRASYSAMKSAMSIMQGDPDKRALFEAAMEATADDVAQKVAEMERFMQTSAEVLDSVDLQNGVFEDRGLKMLEDWEKQSDLLLLQDPPQKQSRPKSSSDYDTFFN